MNIQKLNSAIAEFTKKKKANAAYYEENWAERKERKEYYQYTGKKYAEVCATAKDIAVELKKAQSNAAVQAVVAVADEEQLAKIISESAGVIDEKSLRTWDSEDVLAVYDSLVRAHESINKLALVPESF